MSYGTKLLAKRDLGKGGKVDVVFGTFTFPTCVVIMCPSCKLLHSSAMSSCSEFVFD